MSLYLFHVVQCVEECGIDDVKRKMAAPEEDHASNIYVTNKEPSACDALVQLT